MAAFEVVEYDVAAGEVRVVSYDGQETRAQVVEPRPGTPIARTAWRPADRLMQIELDDAETFEWHLDAPAAGVEPRPVVYLDQNHWVELARARVKSPKLTGDRLRVYERFLEMAADQAIIVPLSSAHFVELGRKSGQQRRDVAVTMMQAARGWQMRNPLTIRDEELASVFGAEAKAGPVFTLDASGLFSHGGGTEPPPASVFEETVAQLATVSALADVLSDTDVIESGDGLAKAEAWATSFSELATHVAGNPKAKARLREVTRVRFISDIQLELAAAARAGGLTPELFATWVTEESEEAFKRLPALGRFREVVHLRLTNSSDRWDRNDLYDLIFLTTAAGYADVVVGERKMANYLRQVDGACMPGAKVYATMTDALGALEAVRDDDHLGAGSTPTS